MPLSNTRHIHLPKSAYETDSAQFPEACEVKSDPTAATCHSSNHGSQAAMERIISGLTLEQTPDGLKKLVLKLKA